MERPTTITIKSPRNMNKTGLQILLKSKGIPYSSRETIKELQLKLRNFIGTNKIIIPSVIVDLKSPVFTKTYKSAPININELENKINDLENKQNMLVDYIKLSRSQNKRRCVKQTETEKLLNEKLSELYKKLIDNGFIF
jgi:hypothetical protein